RTERAERSANIFTEWWQDFRYAGRTLRRSKGFAAVSLVTLALAIGANTAIFSVARAVLLKPLPYRNADEIVQLHDFPLDDQKQTYQLTPANFADIRDQQRTLTDLATFRGTSITWQPVNADPEIVSAAMVTPNTFEVLGVHASHGRTFIASDSSDGADQQVILSNKFWQRAYGGDTTAVGKTIMFSGRPYHITGILPAGFTLGIDDEMWIPYRINEALSDGVRARRQHYLRVIGRLKPGVTITQARSEITTIASRLAVQYPESNKNMSTGVRTLREAMTGTFAAPLLLLQSAAIAVLLIACANLANLTLSRTIGRRREMAVRAALGAGRMRIIRQLATESLVLAVLGGTIGALLAGVATRRLLALNPEAVPAMYDASVDTTVLAFSIGLSVFTGLLFGLVPALGASRANVNDALKQGGRGSSGSRSGELIRRVLVVTQTCLAVMLLIGAGLLVRSFDALTSVTPGYATDHIMTAQVRTTGVRYDTATIVNQFYDGVFRDIARAPGVVAVGGGTVLPTRGHLSTKLRIVGEPTDESNLPDLGYQAVRGDYFKVMHIPLKQGRLYNDADALSTDKPVIISEGAASKFFPKGDAVGRQIRIGPDERSAPWRIVGVVGDIRDEGLDMPGQPMMFANHALETWDATLNLVVRTTGDPQTAVAALRRAVKEHDATLAIRDVRSFDDVIGSSLAPRRFALGLASSFAVVALLLGAVGIYGVLAYAVSNRTREFGVRLALGATPRSVIALVLQHGLVWSTLGLLLGLVGAVAFGRLLSGMLYDVRPLDPTTYLLVAAGQLVVVVLACVVPAVRATRVDPLTSMRAE
ncbi:MAG: ABC transporter permease, partial [Gemmatimonas sp.]